MKSLLNSKIIPITLLFFCVHSFFAQDKVLIFTKTNGFRHESIGAGIQMIKDLGAQNELWQAVNTQSAADFNTENLSQYKAVIWCNTSGDDLLNAVQQQAFEEYIGNGGGFVGIHAATDTYRSRSWPFYNELVGGIVQTDPNHTASNYEATMTVVNSHPAVDFLDATYTKKEEYYYWKINGGYLYPDNIDLLQVEMTGDKEYDEPRPISWYKEYKGGRSFYTALGHNAIDYTADTNFIHHVEEGIKYAMGITLSIRDYDKVVLTLYPNPAKDKVILKATTAITSLHIYNINGQEVDCVLSSGKGINQLSVDSSALQKGIYFVVAQGEKEINTVKLIKK